MLDGLKTNLQAAIKKLVSSSGVEQGDVETKLVLEVTEKIKDRAINEKPPPFAELSSFVTTMPPTGTIL